MKKLLLSISALTLVGVSFAQQRKVLVESFSQASCVPCASQNPAMEALLVANSTKAVSIKYQVSWPGFDPMYLHNPTEIDARVDYYNISGVPDRVLDGTNQDANQANIDNRYAVASPINMTISHTINPGFTTADVTVTITAPAVWNPSSTVLHVGMVEKTISFPSAPGSNGETEFHNVMRKMLSGWTGNAVVASNFASAGGSQTFTFTNVAIPSYIYDLNEVGFVAWVQNTSTKEVFQANMSEPVALSNYGIVQSVSVPEGYSCANTITGATGTVLNQGNTTITSATINYSLNGGAAQTIPYTGNLASGATYNFSIPTLSVTTSGTQVISSYLTNINGSGLTNPIGTKTTTFSRVTDNGAVGAFVQNFSNASFPYNNYYVTSPTGDNWVRSTANTGCLKYDNYSYASGKNGETYLAPVDLSSNTNKAMKFDVAYAQYVAENDKLDVLVSTDCGATWTNVYTKQGANLSTVPAQTAGFTPTSAGQWRNETVDLTAFGSATKLIVKFKATSAYGNNLYVDNINIGGTAGIAEENLMNVNIFPNPANDIVNVVFEGNGGDYNIVISDLVGRIVSNTTSINANGSTKAELSISDLNAGNYLVTISNGISKYTQTLMVK
jgi:hypothetical protein